MALHIPLVTGDEGLRLATTIFKDSDVFRISLDKAERFAKQIPKGKKIWIDPCVDGMHELETRRSTDEKKNAWFDFMSTCENFEAIASPTFHKTPAQSRVGKFVTAILDKCASFDPAWISIPQLPIVDGADRNKINRCLATATAEWRERTKNTCELILPLVFTHQQQLNRKTQRNAKVEQAKRCFEDAGASGLWVVDKNLNDDSGSKTLTDNRFPGIIGLHEELRVAIGAKTTIAGPYWALNLLLWARGLIDYPAIGVGSGYQYFMSGGHAHNPTARIAIPSLRRLVEVAQLATWLDNALLKLKAGEAAHIEYSGLRKQLGAFNDVNVAREQVARFYKSWFDSLAAVPADERALTLYTQLSDAYVLGKKLPELAKTPKRPEAVAEMLMLSCF